MLDLLKQHKQFGCLKLFEKNNPYEVLLELRRKDKDDEDDMEKDDDSGEEDDVEDEEDEPEVDMDDEEREAPPRPKGVTAKVWKHVSDEMRDIVTAIADAGRHGQAVRIRYRPEVTKWPRDVGVYRTVDPYSLRVRNIHVQGYDSPPEPTIVFFGYDRFSKDGPSIKMFVVDRIINFERRGQTFTPRWDVEWETRSSQGTLQMCDEELRIVDAMLDDGNLWIVTSGIHTSDPMSKADAISRKKELNRNGYKAKISLLGPQEMTTSGSVGSYDVPLGSQPIGRPRRRKKKKKKKKAG